MFEDDDMASLFTVNDTVTNPFEINVRFEKKAHYDAWIKTAKGKLKGYISPKTRRYNLSTHYSSDWSTEVTPEEKIGTFDERMSHWKNMPTYTSENIKHYCYIIFEVCDETKALFEDVIEQSISDLTKSVWIPKRAVHPPHTYNRIIGDGPNNKYPIYIVSKGRPNDCTTSFHLSLMEVPHYIVVEPQQIPLYQASTLLDFRYATLLELDLSYQDNYDTYDDLGNTKSKGPGAARNFAWEHSIKDGFAWHWVFDDNAIGGFYRFHKNRKIRCKTGSYFRAIEDWCDRYENIGQAGLNYQMFIAHESKYPPFVTNTRIYSFLLIRNDVPYRWRGRYNEDTDLSLRILKDGWCTVQFNAFLADKARTQLVGGGNTEEFYAKEGTVSKSQMLVDMHPDVATLSYRFKREHHYVDYTGFKQKLKLKPGIELTNKVDDYGMVISRTKEETGDKTKEKYKSQLNELYLNDKCVIPYNKFER